MWDVFFHFVIDYLLFYTQCRYQRGCVSYIAEIRLHWNHQPQHSKSKRDLVSMNELHYF